MSKENFLIVYGRAHLHALTPNLIRTAFRKTGIIPFNHNVISKEAVAPAKEISAEGYLPVVTDLEIQKLADALQWCTLRDASASDSSKQTDGGASRSGGEERQALSSQSGTGELSSALGAEQLRDMLLSGHFAHLVLSEPLVSTDPIPSFQLNPIHGTPPVLPNFEPKTTMEKNLLLLLWESEGCKAALQAWLRKAQASNVLNQLYCNRLHSQLAFTEEKNKKVKGKRKGQLMGNGLPAFLSGDEWWEKLMDWEAAQQEEERQRTAKRQEKEEMAEHIAIWKSSEKVQVERNNRRREQNKDALRVWVKNRDAAKRARRLFKDAKPVPEPIEKPTPRPKATDAVEEMEESGPESEDDDDDDDDE